MALACPNKASQEWRELVRKIGKDSAMEEYIKYGDIPDPAKYNRVALKDRSSLKEDLPAMKEWFESRFDGVSFKTVKSLIDGRSFGQFYNGIVTLYENAEIGTGYHEAFHKVTQLYLAPSQRRMLYEEVREKKGWMDDLAAEEVLAEDFREYMLNGQQNILGRPKSTNIFKRLWRMLNSFLFGTTSIQEVYEKLASSKGYTGIPRVNIPMVNKLDRVSFLNEYDTRLVLEDFTNNFFSYLFDISRLTPETFLRSDDSFKKTKIDEVYKDIYAIYQADIKTFDAAIQRAKDSGVDYSGLERSREKHVNILKGFEELRRAHYDYLVQYGIKITVSADQKIEEIRDSTTQEVQEYTDKENGSEDELDDDADKDQEVGDDLNPYTPANEVNQVEHLSTNTKLLIMSLPQMEYRRGKSSLVMSPLMRNKLINFKDTYNQIAYALKGLDNEQDMFIALRRLGGPTELARGAKPSPNTNPSIQQLVKKLGDPANISKMGRDDKQYKDMWRDFVTDFSKTLSEGSTTIVDPDTGRVVQDSNLRHNLRDRLKQKWRANLLDSDVSYYDDNGVLKLRDDVFEKTGVEFLKAIGIEFEGYTDKEVLDLLPKVFGGESTFNRNINNISKALKGYTGHIDEVFDKGIDGQYRGNFNTIADFIGERTKHTIELSYRNAEGKRVYGITQHNYLSLVVDSINNVKSLSELKAKHPHLVNIYNKRSAWLNTLFDKEGKRTSNRIELVTVSGLKAERGDGANTTSLHEVDKVVQEFNDLLMVGGVSLPRASDKSTEYAIRVEYTGSRDWNAIGTRLLVEKGELDKDKHVDVLYDSFLDELDRIRSRRIDGVGEDIKVYGLPPEAKLAKGDEERIEEIFKGDKYKRDRFGGNASRYKAYEKHLSDRGIEDSVEAIDYWWRTSPTSANFSIFEDILSPSTKEALIPSMEDWDTLPDEKLIKEDIKDYFDKLITRESRVLKELGIGDDVVVERWEDGKKVEVTIPYGINPELLAEGNATVKDLYRLFIVNHFLETIEHHKVLIGDPALYKDKFKRISAYTGTKDFMKGGVFIDYINNTRDFDEYPDREEWKVAVVKDVNVVSSMIGEYSTAVNENRLGEYGNMTEADAQGLIDIVAYKRMMDRSKRWTDAQELQYQFEMAWGKRDQGLKLSALDNEILNRHEKEGDWAAFPIAKAQYAGPQAYNGDVNLQAFHKYSLAPIFPRLVKGTPLENKLKQMRKAEVGYVVFDSGSKVGTKTAKDGSQHDLLSGDEFSPEHIQTIHTRYLGIQVDIQPKAKEKVIFGTQFRKLLESNLFSDGVIAVPELAERHEEYKSLIGKLVDGEWSKLLKELDAKEVDGNISLNKEKLVAIVRAEAISRNLANNTIESVDVIDDPSGLGGKILRYQLDSLVNRNKVEALLMSIVNSRIVRQKMPGDAMVQMATTGFKKENASYDDELETYRKDIDFNALIEGGVTYTDKGKSSVLKALDLDRFKDIPVEELEVSISKVEGGMGVTINHGETSTTITFTKSREIRAILALSSEYTEAAKTAKTLPAQVKVSINAQYKPLLDIYGGLDAVNAAIREGKIDKRILTMVGYRIPTQGMNSIEHMEIVEFLPYSTMNTIILPSEIVAKSGGDFDIDKLNIFRPSFRIEYKGETELSYAQKKVKLYEETTGEKLDELDQELFDEIVEWYYELPKSAWPKEGLEAIVLSSTIGYQKYIKGKVNTLRYIEYEERSGKAGIQNRIIEIASQIISHPYNYELLVTPNSVDTLKGAVGKIREAKGISTKQASQTRQIEFSYILDQFKYFLGGKNNVGPSAIHNTFHTLFQQAGTSIPNTRGVEVKKDTWKEFPRVYFASNDTGKRISLGSTKDKAGNWISDTISQFINAYVDVAKDPFYKDLNAGDIPQGVYFYLMHMGVDIETITYFMTQPAIVELTDALAMNDNIMNGVYGKTESRYKIVERIVKKYNDRIFDIEKKRYSTKDESWMSSMDDKSILLKHMSTGYRKGTLIKDLKDINDIQYLKDQLQAVLNFETYSKDANELGKLIRTLKYDTSKPKDLASLESHKELVKEVYAGGLFTKRDREAILSKTIVGKFDKYDEIERMYTPLFITESKDFKDARRQMVSMISPSTQDDTVKLKTLINNDFINYLTQRYYWLDADKTPLHTEIDTLFKGMDSVGRRLMEVKRLLPADNYLVEQLQPMLTQDLTDLDNISIFTKKYTVDESNSLTASYKELLEHDNPVIQDFARALTKHGILQSGLNNSPITYLGLIPHEEYGKYTEKAISEYGKLTQSERYTTYNDFFIRFLLKNADKSFVVPYGKKERKEDPNTFEVYYDLTREIKRKAAYVERDKEGNYVLYLKVGKGFRRHDTVFPGLRLNRYGYKLQDFYLNEGIDTTPLKMIEAPTPTDGGDTDTSGGSTPTVTGTVVDSTAPFSSDEDVKGIVGIESTYTEGMTIVEWSNKVSARFYQSREIITPSDIELYDEYYKDLRDGRKYVAIFDEYTSKQKPFSQYLAMLEGTGFTRVEGKPWLLTRGGMDPNEMYKSLSEGKTTAPMGKEKVKVRGPGIGVEGIKNRVTPTQFNGSTSTESNKYIPKQYADSKYVSSLNFKLPTSIYIEGKSVPGDKLVEILEVFTEGKDFVEYKEVADYLMDKKQYEYYTSNKEVVEHLISLMDQPDYESTTLDETVRLMLDRNVIVEDVNQLSLFGDTPSYRWYEDSILLNKFYEQVRDSHKVSVEDYRKAVGGSKNTSLTFEQFKEKVLEMLNNCGRII